MKKVLTELALIKAIECRSEIAVAQLYDHYAGTLFNIIIIQVKDREIAEEVLKSTFLSIWDNISDFHSQDDRLLLWMAGIAEGLALEMVTNLKTQIKKKISTEMPAFVPALNGMALS